MKTCQCVEWAKCGKWRFCPWCGKALEKAAIIGKGETTYLSIDYNCWTPSTNNIACCYIGGKRRWLAVGKKVKVSAKEPKMRGRR